MGNVQNGGDAFWASVDGEKAKDWIKDAYKWTTTPGNLEKAAESAWDWAGKGENWQKLGNDVVEGAQKTGDWIANNPRKIGRTAGEFIPDAVAAFYTAGGSLAATAGKTALKEGAEAIVERTAKEVAEAGAAKAGKEALEAGAKKGIKETLEQLAKKEGDDIAAVVTKEVDRLTESAFNKLDDIPNPPNTFRDSKGRLRDKNGKFTKDSRTKKVKGKKPRYQRNISERRKALKRDAKDPNSALDQKAREYIDKHDGKKVPNKKYNEDYDGEIDYAVHHEEPLYTEKSVEGKKKLDKAEKMKTIPEDQHMDTHSHCGSTYHAYGPPQNFK